MKVRAENLDLTPSVFRLTVHDWKKLVSVVANSHILVGDGPLPTINELWDIDVVVDYKVEESRLDVYPKRW